MTWLGIAAAFVALIALSAVFSGAETGFYRLSSLRVDARAGSGSRSAQLIAWMVRDDSLLLITILIGNNLVIEATTHLFEDWVVARTGVAEALRELTVTLCLTPVLFFFAELLPKDLFRRRPHDFVAKSVWIVAAARIVFLPLSIPLRGLARMVERLAGLGRQEVARIIAREKVLELLAEGTRGGEVEEQAGSLARNVFELRTTHLAAVMIPWAEVEVLELQGDPVELRARVAAAAHTRLPVIEAGRVERYVHQLDLLGAGPDSLVADHLRPLLVLAPETSVDRALVRMRGAGQRQALVGDPAEPLGLVTLKDLVEEISGELWGLVEAIPEPGCNREPWLG